jgi:hypothetical protein
VVVHRGILGDRTVDDGMCGLTSIPAAKVNLKILNHIQSSPLTVDGIYLHCDITSRVPDAESLRDLETKSRESDRVRWSVSVV